MNIHPVVSQLNGVISVQMQAQFLGATASPPDTTQDAIDQSLILGYGDPKVNLGGSFTDISGSPPTTFQFRFGTPQKFVGITTEMSRVTARFYTVVPQDWPREHHDWSHESHISPVDEHRTGLPQPMDCLTTDPERAATAWALAIQDACQIAMEALRANPSPLATLPDADI